MKRSILVLFSLVILISMALSACQPGAATDAVTAPEGEDAYPAPAEGESASAAEPTDAGYPAPAAENTQPAAETGEVIEVGTDATFPPFELVDEATQELTGFDIELIRAIAEINGWEININNQPFDPMMIALEQCTYDVAAAAITITPEREEVMLFSDPYINAGQVVVVEKGNTDITGRESLSGMTVGAQLGTTGAIETQAIEGVEFKPYDTYDLAFLDLMNGQIDAVIADYPLALDFIGQNEDKLQTAGEPFTEEYYGIAVCNEREDLVEPINAALQTLKDNGTLAELEQKWLARQGAE